MRRTAILLLIVVLTAESGHAQRAIDGPAPEIFGRGPLNCDPSGNIDEIPFEPSSVPFEDWLKGREVRQIPMEMTVRPPELRMDQQTAVFYEATVELKDLRGAQDRKIAFFVGVDSGEGKRLTETSVHAVNVPPQTQGGFDLTVFGCVYVQPGSYSLWVAAFDESTGRHSVRRQNVRVSQIKNDPLPLIDSKTPLARFPAFTPEETELSRTLPTPLFLPVSNKRPLAVDIISLTPYQRQAIGPLTQLILNDSTISVATLDLDSQKVVYDSRAAGKFDFTEMLKATELHRQQGRTIDLSVLLNRRDRAGYLRQFLEQRIKSSAGIMRVVIVVSSSMTFPRGTDTSAIQLDANCECRLFHIQMFPGNFDDVGKVLKSPQSRRFEAGSALEFRKVLASIVRELEAL